ERLQPGAEAALGAPDPLGHGPDLAVVLRQQDHDAVGLPQLVGPQHDPAVAVEAPSSAPGRSGSPGRSRPPMGGAPRPWIALPPPIRMTRTRAGTRKGTPGVRPRRA